MSKSWGIKTFWTMFPLFALFILIFWKTNLGGRALAQKTYGGVCNAPVPLNTPLYKLLGQTTRYSSSQQEHRPKVKLLIANSFCR